MRELIKNPRLVRTESPARAESPGEGLLTTRLGAEPDKAIRDRIFQLFQELAAELP